MANYATIVHHTRFPAPLAAQPNTWQPRNYHHNIYHSSHCDIAQSGWRKWSSHQPDWYARSAEAWHPDWYARRVDTIRQANTKERLWPWELTSRPTEKRVYGLARESPRPVQRGFQAVPHQIQGQVEMPRWGLFHPDHYSRPSRVEHLPTLHSDEKHH